MFLYVWSIGFICFIGMSILAWRAQSQCKRLIEDNVDLMVLCDSYIDQYLNALTRIGDALEWLEPTAQWDRPIPEETDGALWAQYRESLGAQELIDILLGEQDEEKE